MQIYIIIRFTKCESVNLQTTFLQHNSKQVKKGPKLIGNMITDIFISQNKNIEHKVREGMKEEILPVTTRVVPGPKIHTHSEISCIINLWAAWDAGSVDQ